MSRADMFFLTWMCLLVSAVDVSYGDYEISPVIMEAYKTGGFRASVKATPGIELFAFYGKLNKEINHLEPGEFSGDVSTPVDGYFTYHNPNLKLKLNDMISYLVYIQHNKFGYLKNPQKWKVTELRSSPEKDCPPSVTRISDRTKVCRHETVLEDKFDGSQLNSTIWTVEQYVPGAPDYEFVVYRQNENVIYLSNDSLTIKPELANEEDLEADTLDLTDNCTKQDVKDQFCVYKKFLMQNPIVSGRLVSKQTFSYADVEVRAKLPSGDWIFPEIYLEDENQQRLVIAYARGNRYLTGSDNVNVGGNMLFGGPMLEHNEPKRSEKLISSMITKYDMKFFCDDFHTYKLRWTEDAIDLYVDGIKYGLINSESIKSSGFFGSTPKQVRLVLGVGVGGINDFPDGYKSGEHKKPWRNLSRKQVKTFYTSKGDWLSTWANGGKLQVDFVKVTAV